MLLASSRARFSRANLRLIPISDSPVRIENKADLWAPGDRGDDVAQIGARNTGGGPPMYYSFFVSSFFGSASLAAASSVGGFVFSTYCTMTEMRRFEASSG